MPGQGGSTNLGDADDVVPLLSGSKTEAISLDRCRRPVPGIIDGEEQLGPKPDLRPTGFCRSA
jgi:hypothetical protein